MKNYWNDQGLIKLAFSTSLLFCIAFQLTSFILLSKQITATSEGQTKLQDFRYKNTNITEPASFLIFRLFNSV